MRVFCISLGIEATEGCSTMSRHLMTAEHQERISVAPDHYSLWLVAKDILDLLPDSVGMVCGPISTGGLGDITANIARFNEAIDILTNHNIILFNQMPFESRLAELLELDETGYDWRILNHFYEPIFRTGIIKTKFFIPGWEGSTGASWERKQAEVLGIQIIDLNSNLLPIW